LAKRSLSGTPLDASTNSASMRTLLCGACLGQSWISRTFLEITRGEAEGRRDGALEYYSIRSSRPAKINIMRMLLQISIPHDPFKNGRSAAFPEVHVWRLANEKVTEFREFQEDEQTEDRFWS
jgi:hypothetical protein